jgi:hypothetical protein
LDIQYLIESGEHIGFASLPNYQLNIQSM